MSDIDIHVRIWRGYNMFKFEINETKVLLAINELKISGVPSNGG